MERRGRLKVLLKSKGNSASVEFPFLRRISPCLPAAHGSRCEGVEAVMTV